ncbi:hypothetical protein B6I21_00905 [candidate division KSB1 bacterium 4572_119]|nr:MAG: hypothetical protein B6I21_00905 [candidate division KSB1 bacterium 4572_119]
MKLDRIIMPKADATGRTGFSRLTVLIPCDRLLFSLYKYGFSQIWHELIFLIQKSKAPMTFL